MQEKKWACFLCDQNKTGLGWSAESLRFITKLKLCVLHTNQVDKALVKHDPAAEALEEDREPGVEG